jgi:exonuclease VII small subunit
MPESLNTSVTSMEESIRRIFAAIESLTENEKKLDAALARLAEARTAAEKCRQRTDRPFLQIDASMEKSSAGTPSMEDIVQARMDAERSRQLDAEIDKLLADIREWRRNRQ